MKKTLLILSLASCLLLGGCASLLERSYSVVEPYADRYWDSAAEDTLKAENYQDLVNSLLMQVEQRAESCVIRGYGDAASYGQARAASREVRTETIPGAYLLARMTFTFEESEAYCTFSFQMRYREDAEDIDSLMSLSDCQSLVDLLRLSVREEHDKLAARFVRDMRREEVRAAVEGLWQELCQGEAEAGSPPPEITEDSRDTAEPASTENEGTPAGEEPEAPLPEGDAPPEPDVLADPDVPAPLSESKPPDGEPVETMVPVEEPVEYPPCPWAVRFYPDMDGAGIVEVLLPDRPPA